MAPQMKQTIAVVRQFSARFVTRALLLAAFCTISGATTVTFTLDPDPHQVYLGVNVGPFGGTLTGTGITQFFCLNNDKNAAFGGSYTGTVVQPTTQAEDEVAFLTSYLLSKGAPSSDPTFVRTYEGPVSFAIWQIMGTLGGTSPDPAAAQYVTMAQDAYTHGQITPGFLSNFLIFLPNDPTVQRFITAYEEPYQRVPEPQMMLVLASGMVVIGASRRWMWRKVC